MLAVIVVVVVVGALLAVWCDDLCDQPAPTHPWLTEHDEEIYR